MALIFFEALPTVANGPVFDVHGGEFGPLCVSLFENCSA